MTANVKVRDRSACMQQYHTLRKAARLTIPTRPLAERRLVYKSEERAIRNKHIALSKDGRRHNLYPECLLSLDDKTMIAMERKRLKASLARMP